MDPRVIVDAALEMTVVPSFSSLGITIRRQLFAWPALPDGALRGRTVLVTGPTSGLGRAAADGLAVGRASGFVGRAMERLLDGFYTLDDQTMYDMLGWLAAAENIRLEPSALAGMAGAQRVCASKAYHQLQGLSEQQQQQATHLVWATGGGMVPEEEMAQYLAKGR